jgi:hypothetical protein
MMAACQPFTFWAVMGYADSTVMLFVLSSALYAAAYLEEGKPADLWISLLSCLFLTFTKDEGMAIAGGVVVLTCLLSAVPRRPARFWLSLRVAGVVFLLLLPWLFYRHTLPVWDEDYAGRISLTGMLANLGRLGAILRGFASEAAWNWGGVWWIAGASVVLNWRGIRRPAVMMIVLLMAAQAGMYAVAYLVTPWKLAELMPVTIDRLFLQMLPLPVILIAMNLGAIFQEVPMSAKTAMSVAPS